ncbi:MAG TPA: phosphate ABC transporter permease subunit PstC [Bacillales bacterium]|nr:phosphate ABC transporter permease subunit PstC [Bacillales bacterium]
MMKTKTKNGLFTKKSELRGKLAIYVSAMFILAATVAITVFLTEKGLQSFVISKLNVFYFLTNVNWHPEKGHFGALAFIFGSFSVTFLAAIVAAPLGIGSAIFMTEIAKRWGQKLLQPVIEILVGIPSVVYGFIGLTVIVPLISKNTGTLGYGLLASAIVVGVMILPTVTSIAADALKAIPNDMKNASYALGATRWQTLSRVVIPAALPSLLTAVVLGMARAFGEALAVQMVIGNAKGLPHSLVDPAATLTTIITLSLGHTTYGSTLNNALWSLGLILLVMSYIFIILIRFLSRRRKLR